MAIIGVLGMMAIIISLIMIVIGFIKRGSNLKSKGFKVLGIGFVMFFAALLLDDKPPKIETKPQISQQTKTEVKPDVTNEKKEQEKKEQEKKEQEKKEQEKKEQEKKEQEKKEQEKKEQEKKEQEKKEQIANEENVKQAITSICKDTLGSNYISVTVNDNYSDEPGAKGTKIVLLTGKVRDGFSDDMIRKANINDARDIFKALYTSGQPISEAVYFAEAELVDNYGKTSKGNAFKFTMSKKTADKIDWNNINGVELDKFASILDSTWMLPQFRKK